MLRNGLRWSLVAMTVSALAAPLVAQAQETATVVAGEGYDAGGLHRMIFGQAYRDLWGMPIEVPLLDLEKDAGGLTPLMVVGGLQTAGLALRGADGRSYTFRGVHKDLVLTLPEELRDTALADMAQDQLVASLPGGEVVAVPLLNTVGVLQPAPRLVVMPDVPALGEFRERFAGLLGTFSEFPSPGPDGAPGTYGATEIYDGFEAIELLAASPETQIDDRALLKARLMDVLLGDWDRHIGQWRFARIEGEDRLQPISEDRDQAFSRYEGLAMTFARDREPKFDRFHGEYQGLEGLTWNARSVDRRFLSGLDRATWLEVAREIQSELADSTIEAAVALLPGPYHDAVGEGLVGALIARRDRLGVEAERFYDFLTEQVNVFGTDVAELVQIAREPDGSVTISIARRGGDGGPGCGVDQVVGETYFHRRFDHDEVDSVRLYIGAGDDRVLLTGPPSGAIKVRVIGGGGSNLLCDHESGRTFAFDDSNTDVPGKGVKVSRGLYVAAAETLAEAGTPEATQGTALKARRDWGSTGYGVPVVGFGPDFGLLVGFGRVWENYSFRKRPYATQHQLRAGFAFGALRPRIDYAGYYRHENRRSFWIVRALGSGIETLRYYGRGNDTSATGDVDFYRVKQTFVGVEARIAVKLGDHLTVSTGPTVRYSTTDTDDGDDRFISVDLPYGVESIGQAGWVAGFTFNNRTFPGVREQKGSDEPFRWGPPELGRGYTLQINAHQYPAVWDLRDSYGWAEGQATGTYWLGVKGPGFGFRFGGATTWGDVPYYDAAFLGSRQLRGLRPNRFAGESSAYANASLLLPLGRMTLLVPGHWGILASGGVGRVWVDGEDSDTWHTSYGGGLWWAPWNLQNAVRLFVATSDESTLFYALLGFDF